MSGPVGIGLIGLGARGQYLGKAFHAHPNARLVAICDVEADRLQAAVSGFGLPDLASYPTAARLLEDPRVQAVVVATPDRAHAENGMEVLRARKHLFLEKPMAQTVEDCDALIEAWKEARTVFMVGLELRYCSLAEEMKRILDRGDIGEIRLGYAIDNVSVGGRYYFHDSQRRKEISVNLLLQKGTHTIDLMNWWFGSDPVRVWAEGGLDAFGGSEPNDKRCRDCERNASCPEAIPRELTLDYGERAVRRDDLCVWAQEVDVEDNTIVTVRYANGAKMSYVECHFSPDYNRHFSLIGTRGRMYGFYNNEQDFRIEIDWRHSGRREILHPEKRPGGHGGGDPRIQDEFIRTIRRGEAACPGVEGARNSAAIGAAAAIAMRAGTPATIPPCPIARRDGTC